MGRCFIFSPTPSCNAKKLIARVRPGVEDTFASRDPSSELISEDFPTFDRPRNAISGAPNVFASVGKCATSVADKRNTGLNRILAVYPLTDRNSQSAILTQTPKSTLFIGLAHQFVRCHGCNNSCIP